MENYTPELVVQATRIGEKLEKLKDIDREFHAFGAAKHRYRLDKPLTEVEIAQFENEHSVALPPEYRVFLAAVGSGGAGPFYGLETLADSLYGDLDYKSEDYKVDLSAPFPHTDYWNLDRDDYASDAEFEEIYYDKQHSRGVLRLANFGCGVSVNLVVKGEDYGKMWLDDRCNDNGIYYALKGGVLENGKITFLDWYEEWLNDELAERR